MSPEPWISDAACRGMSTDIFFPPQSTNGKVEPDLAATAKTVCARCPVADQCLRLALTTDAVTGIYGGHDRYERRRIARHDRRRAG